MQKNSKSKNIIINIICIFSVIALIVAMASIFGHITKSSVSLLPPKSDNSEEPEQPTPEEPEEQEEPEVDPSLTFINFDIRMTVVLKDCESVSCSVMSYSLRLHRL